MPAEHDLDPDAMTEAERLEKRRYEAYFAFETQPMKRRIRISTYGGGETVQHWQLYFDDQFLCDTSAPQHVEKWRELERLVNRDDCYSP